MKRTKRLAHWLSLRNSYYIVARLLALLNRYGITATKAKQRVVDCVKLLAQYGCYPTFPTPGRVVARNSQYCRVLQQMGVELAVHGYDHVDFNSLSLAEATAQFVKATDAFTQSGIQIDGFRCPYLSYSDRLLATIPDGHYRYSSNRAIVWNVLSEQSRQRATAIFESLGRFYKAESAEANVATPGFRGHIVEIPASVPDDIQLYDGLKLGEEGIRQAWMKILQETYSRGEIFVVLFHPETFEQCHLAFESILQEAKRRKPAIWVTQLRDVSRWWWEKARFTASVSENAARLHIEFNCSPRSTVLLRNVKTSEPTHGWDAAYRVLDGRVLSLPGDQYPFIGVSKYIPGQIVSFLKEQGYIVYSDEHASRCALYLDTSTQSQTQVSLIDYIERSPAPLVRFWRWPEEAKSALCITGDLDALSLVDYLSRLVAH